MSQNPELHKEDESREYKIQFINSLKVLTDKKQLFFFYPCKNLQA